MKHKSLLRKILVAGLLLMIGHTGFSQLVIGTVPKGDSIVIRHDVTIIASPPPGTDHVAAQWTIQGGNFATFVSNDPDTVTPLDSTITPLVLCPTIIVTNPVNTTGTAGTAFSETFTAAGGTSPYTFTTASTLPTGLTLSSAGVLSGTPTQAGTFIIVVTAKEFGSTCTGNGATYTLVIGCPAAITGTATPSAQTVCSGVAITNIVLAGAPAGAVYNWSRDNTGGTITGIANSGSGSISGTMTNTTTAPITVTFTITPTYYGTCLGTPYTATVLVNPRPVAIATPSSQTICSGQAITPIVLSSATSGTTYSWTRDNTGTVTGIAGTGTTDISGSLTNTTSAPITVSFVITATANGCTNPTTTTATVLVNPTPSATATPASQTICSGATITTIVLSGSPVAGTTYNWTRDNTGGTVTGIAASGSGNISGALTNTTAAPITVTFTIIPTANSCPGAAITATVLVNPTPSATATPSSQTICSGATITPIVLSGSPVAGTVYNWSRDNTAGTVTGIANSGSGNITGSLTNTTAAPITVTFTIIPTANSCPGTAITATVLVNPTPVAVATPSSQTICSGNAITTIVLSSATSGTTYTWSRNNTGTVTGITGTGSGNISGSLTNTTTSPITVTFTISSTANSCPGADITATVLVNPGPPATATPSSQTICSGATITTIALTSPTPGTTYAWTRDNTGTVTGIAAGGSGDISGALTNTTAAPVTVTFTITPTAAGCIGAPITATVLVNPTPVAVATPSSQTICSGATITTIVLSSTTSGTTYAWSRDNTGGTVTGIAASGSGNITGSLTNTTANPITVTFTITPTANSCPGAAITATVLVNPTPVAVATPSSQTICSGATITTIVLSSATSGTTYAWTRDNTAAVTGIAGSGSGNISGALTNTTNAPVTVTFTIIPTANSCPGAAITATVLVNPTPNAVATPASQTICSGTTITTIGLSGNVSGTTFNWTRDNTAAVPGIAAGGSGDISGDLTNTTTLPLTVTFTITPTANGCPGPSTTATVLVNPRPNATATPSSQTICSGATITTIALTSPTPGTTYTWTRDNTATVTGIAATGSGNISGALTNTTAAPILVTFLITPSANGCTGPVFTATVLVNPTPVATATPSSQTTCSGQTITTIVLTSPTAGTTYAWTRDNTVAVTGIAASGSGNISGALTNTTSSPVTVTFTITPTANGCPGAAITATVLVNPMPDATATPSSQTVCSNVPITTIVLSGTVSGTVFNWVRDNTAAVTGIAANGSGDISGTLTNTTTAPVTVTFTITPTANGCTPGAPITATVLVNPIATVNAVASQVRCHNTATAAVNFTSPTTGGTIVYNWTNDNTSIGLGASGTGNIPSFTATNTGTVPQIATITVTPAYTNGVSCTGTPITFTYTVNPIPNAVATPASQTICSVNPVTTIVLSGNVSGTTFNWTRNNTANVTGIAASGSGNISGTLTNTTNTPQTVTFTITPTANGCTGPTTTATVLVNPTPTVTPQGDIEVIVTGNGWFADEISWTLTNAAGTQVLSGGPYPFDPPPTSSGTVTSAGGPFTFFIEAEEPSGFEDNTLLWEVRCNGVVVASGCIEGPQAFAGCPNVGNLTVPGINGCGSNLGAQTICSGSSIAPVILVGPVAGTVFNWTRDNNANVTGIAASGSGNISGTLTNTTNVPQAVIFTITPTANGCPGPSVTVTITVNPVPNAVATPSSQTICSGAAITPIVLTGNVSGTVFNWTRNNTANVTGIAASGSGNISGTLINTTTSLQTTTFTITPLYTNAGVTCTGTPITATVSVQAPLTIVCPGNITVNAATGTCAATVTFAATVTGTPAPTVTYVPASGSSFPVGTTTVTVTATNSCATVSCTFTVTVLDVQVPAITTHPQSQSKCVGDNVTFNVTSTFVASYQWQSFNGTIWVNIPGATASSYTINNLTLANTLSSYRVQVTGPCGTVTSSNPALLTVYQVPTVVLVASIPPILLPTQILTLTAQATPTGGTYVWRKNGNVIVGATGSTLSNLTVNDVGSYTVTYTLNGCTSTSNIVVVSAQASENFYVYPNPNFGQFQLRFYNQVNEAVIVTVYDSKGSLVYQRSVTTTTPYTSIDINLGSRQQGSYLVELRNSAGKVVGSKWVVVYH